MRTFWFLLAKKIQIKYVLDMEKTGENKVDNFLYQQKFSNWKYIYSESFFLFYKCKISDWRSSRPNVFLRNGALKICSKFTGKHPRRSVISIKLLCNFFEITLYFSVAVLLWSCCIFSEHLFLGTPLGGCSFDCLEALWF